MNFGTLCYESINSPFLRWKFYLDILCQIVFNVSENFVLPLILTSINADYRKYIVSTSSNCLYLRINKVKVIFFRELVNLCRKLRGLSCLGINPYFIIDALETYERGEDFFNQYLEMQRYR